MHTPLTAFGAGPHAYALVAEVLALPEARQKLLLLWLAQHHRAEFVTGLELVHGLAPVAAAS